MSLAKGKSAISLAIILAVIFRYLFQDHSVTLSLLLLYFTALIIGAVYAVILNISATTEQLRNFGALCLFKANPDQFPRIKTFLKYAIIFCVIFLVTSLLASTIEYKDNKLHFNINMPAKAFTPTGQ